jgi:hypothetical protein
MYILNINKNWKLKIAVMYCVFATLPLVSYGETNKILPSEESLSKPVEWLGIHSVADRADTLFAISSSTAANDPHTAQKAWVAGPIVNIGVSGSTIVTTIFTGWTPDNYSICGLDIPAPTMNVFLYRDGIQTYGAIGLSAQNAATVTTSRGRECVVTLNSRYDAAAGTFPAPTPGTYSATVSTSQGSTSATLPLNACSTTSVFGTSPMLRARNEVYTDNLYTLSNAAISSAVTYAGYTNAGTVYRSPTTATFLTLPWKRFFKGAPQLEHFYTSNDSESNAVMRAGYTFETNEGLIYTKQALGTVPLYRFSKFYPATSDLEHYYSTTNSSPSAGWGYEGVAGFVCN